MAKDAKEYRQQSFTRPPGATEILLIRHGESRAATEGQTILDLLYQLDLDPGRVAVELDRRIIKQPLWNETTLNAGAQIEIVQFVGGG